MLRFFSLLKKHFKIVTMTRKKERKNKQKFRAAEDCVIIFLISYTIMP